MLRKSKTVCHRIKFLIKIRASPFPEEENAQRQTPSGVGFLRMAHPARLAGERPGTPGSPLTRATSTGPGAERGGDLRGLKGPLADLPAVTPHGRDLITRFKSKFIHTSCTMLDKALSISESAS